MSLEEQRLRRRTLTIRGACVTKRRHEEAKSMHGYDNDTRSTGKPDLLLTILLTLMRFNPQEAMIVRAGLKHLVMTVSRTAASLTPRGMPASSYALALSCVALMLPAGQLAGQFS
jgi:hypothetical protein